MCQTPLQLARTHSKNRSEEFFYYHLDCQFSDPKFDSRISSSGFRPPLCRFFFIKWWFAANRNIAFGILQQNQRQRKLSFSRVIERSGIQFFRQIDVFRTKIQIDFSKKNRQIGGKLYGLQKCKQSFTIFFIFCDLTIFAHKFIN